MSAEEDLGRAPLLGNPGPDASLLDEPFWEGLMRNELRLQRCARCSKWIWAPQWRCDSCGSWELDWEAVSPAGRIYSWVRTWHPFHPALKGFVPYVTALVELPEAGGRRLLGVLVGDHHHLRIGAPVSAVMEPASGRTNGYPIVRWSLSEAKRPGWP